MFARQFVNASLSGSVGYEHTGLSKGARSPDVEERAATAVGNPKTGVLSIPTPVEIGIGAVGVVIRVLTGSIRLSSAVSTQEAYVVHQGILASHPFGRHGPGVNPIGVQPNPDHDVGSSPRSYDQRLGRADTLKCRCRIQQIDLRRAGMEAEQYSVLLPGDGIAPHL